MCGAHVDDGLRRTPHAGSRSVRCVLGQTYPAASNRIRSAHARSDRSLMQIPGRCRIAVAVFALSMLVVVPGALTSAASATSSNQDISLTTSSFPSMRPGEAAWVSIFWSGANFDAHNFKLTASSTGATVSYPANTATYSSLYGS